MINYKSNMITINAPDFAEAIIDIVIRHHGLLN